VRLPSPLDFGRGDFSAPSELEVVDNRERALLGVRSPSRNISPGSFLAIAPRVVGSSCGVALRDADELERSELDVPSGSGVMLVLRAAFLVILTVTVVRFFDCSKAEEFRLITPTVRVIGLIAKRDFLVDR
jgi:hypothetical protein